MSQRRSFWGAAPSKNPQPISQEPVAPTANASSQLKLPEPELSSASITPPPDGVLEIAVDTAGVSSVAETVEPTLQALGLYGFSPTCLIIRMHEYIHLTLGFPWISTLIIGAVTLRLLLVPLVLSSMRSSLRETRAAPLLAPVHEKLRIAKFNRDVTLEEKSKAMKMHTKELQAVYKANKINPLTPWGGFIHILAVFGQFFAVREIMATSLPSLRDTGVQHVLDPLIHTGNWLQDITIADSTLVLPLASTLMLNMHAYVRWSQVWIHRCCMLTLRRSIPKTRTWSLDLG